MEVQIENKNETTVSEIVKANETRKRPDIVVVTPDNHDAYVNEKMGIKVQDPEKAAKEERAKLEAEKKEREAKEAKKEEAADVEGEEGVSDHLPKDKKGKLNERFSKITADRKAAEERAEKAAADAKAAREARDAAERLVADLKAKYEPVKTDPDPEPQPSQFQDINEYAKAVKEWAADDALRKAAKKEAEDRQVRERSEAANAFMKRQEEFKKERPDYAEKLANSPVKVSDEIKDAIIESEQGPKILIHLADNPDVAEALGKMTVGRALTEIGRLEARLAPKEVPQKEAKTPVAGISKAPAPITPIKASGVPVETVMNGTQEWHGTFEEYKAKRAAGKIR